MPLHALVQVRVCLPLCVSPCLCMFMRVLSHVYCLVNDVPKSMCLRYTANRSQHVGEAEPRS